MSTAGLALAEAHEVLSGVRHHLAALYNHIPDLQELRSAPVAAQIEGGTR